MTNRLSEAMSPYLRSHADQPVDWYPWGPEAFAEAARRDVPLLVSIGYSTCHWCHVMARESFSDDTIAAMLAAGFVAVKVDREEHPDVDASYLAAAGAFTRELGWPLNVFVTPEGHVFHAGTYSPPEPQRGHPAFRQVLEAVRSAWTERRSEVIASADGLARAIAEAVAEAVASTEDGALPGTTELEAAVTAIARVEDERFGGFGSAPKFPIAPVFDFLLGPRAGEAAVRGVELAQRTLKTMGASALRDPVEGGFFRYAVQQDWTEPHYERMLTDNALLLAAYSRAWADRPSGWASIVATGIAEFLIGTLQQPDGGFGSAQDSESIVDGVRSEGGYYRRDLDGRAVLEPPAVDRKVLTGWNGLAIEALAEASVVFDRPEWLEAARWAADAVIENHLLPDGRLARASLDEQRSDAAAAFEDYGMFASGLLRLALATAEVRYAELARDLVDRCRPEDMEATRSRVAGFELPGGGDPVLASQGMRIDGDPSEGAYPSGISALGRASLLLFQLTGEARYRRAAEDAVRFVSTGASSAPTAFGSGLALAARLVRPASQLIVVRPDPVAGRTDHDTTGDQAMLDAVRTRQDDLVAVVSDSQAIAWSAAGFAVFADRTSREGRVTAYRCEDFVCRLPVTDVALLDAR
ncbi:MAG TPA: thioredoxin domain-containing protein [Plantibacter sp.]|uniref:thioredoxin domain-containing protein n=1 Tax=unclassified Plantibacter TaxID=2624265 RepID=UPI002C8B6DD2|nr:thioredoxin domain-containing protein [Plantibacter sp.]